MSKLDMCYNMLQELRSVIIGVALIHMNREGRKHEGRRIHSTIGDFGGNCASNRSPFNNEGTEEWEEEEREPKSIKNKVRRELLDVVEALDIENSRASSSQMRGIHVVETKVNAVRDWCSPKTLPKVRNNKVANVFQEEDELKSYENLVSKAFVKKGLVLMVTKICKVPLAMREH
nr:hypothetical protein [Tanacetum cinerariifolium]